MKKNLRLNLIVLAGGSLLLLGSPAFPNGDCHYVHAKTKPNLFGVSQDERSDVRMISFKKDKSIFVSNSADAEGPRERKKCSELFQKHSETALEAACFGLIQCGGPTAQADLVACKPVSSYECPTANECKNADNLKISLFKRMKDANLRDPFGLSFLISEKNKTDKESGFVILSTTTNGTRAAYMGGMNSTAEFDIRPMAYPHDAKGNDFSQKKLENLLHQEVSPLAANDASGCILFGPPAALGSYPDLPQGEPSGGATIAPASTPEGAGAGMGD